MENSKNKFTQVKRNRNTDTINATTDINEVYSIEEAKKEAKDHKIKGTNATKW